MISLSVSARLRRRIVAAGVPLAVALTATLAHAADMPDEKLLRGSYEVGPPAAVRWDGILLGAQIGYSNLNADLSSATTTATLAQPSTNSLQYGAFVGYNFQWDNLVVGIDAAYNRPSSLDTSATSGAASASLKLVDYATLRARAGYAFGQFLPYGFIGAAGGRLNYNVVSTTGATNSRDNAYAAGFVAGLGIDVAVTPNIFVRAEYEYVAFSQIGYVENSTFGGIRSSLNTGRVGIGVRF